MRNSYNAVIVAILFTFMFGALAVLCTPDNNNNVIPMSSNTVGIIINNATAYPGYTLFSPFNYNATYLIDNNGKLVHKWDTPGYTPIGGSYFLENGNLLYACKGSGGSRIEVLNWNDTPVWNFPYTGLTHDVIMLPNGNFLVLVNSYLSSAQAIAAGRNPSLITQGQIGAQSIVEVKPTGLTTGTVVWKWSLFDHLIQDYDSSKANYGVVADHSELLDINYALDGTSDWIHSNALDYNKTYDEIAWSSRYMSEIYVIDHNTTTAQAASHSGGKRGMGGDFLYRWGNPRVYRAGNTSTQIFYGQHNVQWIRYGLSGAGDILVFNNGYLRSGPSYSTVEQITPPVQADGSYTRPSPGHPFLPASQSWTYTATPSTWLYSNAMSGAQRLPNGDTLICSANSGLFLEINTTKKIVWEYINPVNNLGPVTQGQPRGNDAVFRCYRYGADYPGLIGKVLTPGNPIEKYPVPEIIILPGTILTTVMLTVFFIILKKKK